MAPPSESRKFPSSEMFDTLVRIEVGTGESKRTFEVFKGVLCFYSGYFEAALNGRFTEAQDHVVKLSTEDPKVFRLFRHWIHTRCFFESTLAPSMLLDCDTLTKLWVFGDAHFVPMFQNEVADIMLQKMRDRGELPTSETICYIFENTVGTSPLRRLVSDVVRKLNWAMTGYLIWSDLNVVLGATQALGQDHEKRISALRGFE